MWTQILYVRAPPSNPLRLYYRFTPHCRLSLFKAIVYLEGTHITENSLAAHPFHRGMLTMRIQLFLHRMIKLRCLPLPVLCPCSEINQTRCHWLQVFCRVLAREAWFYEQLQLGYHSTAVFWAFLLQKNKLDERVGGKTEILLWYDSEIFEGGESCPLRDSGSDDFPSPRYKRDLRRWDESYPWKTYTPSTDDSFTAVPLSERLASEYPVPKLDKEALRTYGGRSIYHVFSFLIHILTHIFSGISKMQGPTFHILLHGDCSHLFSPSNGPRMVSH